MTLIAFQNKSFVNRVFPWLAISIVVLATTNLAAQNVGIGTTTMPFAKLHVVNDVDANTTSISVENRKTGGQRYGVSAIITNNFGAALAGLTMDEGGGTGGIPEGHYGVVGIAGLKGTGIGAFTVGGTGIRADAGPLGIALHTSGQLRFQYIGEAEGNVLTSDEQGNATWRPLAGTHNHYGETWSGNSDFAFTVTTMAEHGIGLFGISENISAGNGVKGISSANAGNGVLGINNVDGFNMVPEDEGAGVMGLAGAKTGVYAAATSGISLHAVKMNTENSAGPVAVFETFKTGLTTPVLQLKGMGNQPVLELNNGYLKVSGDTKTVFQITAGTGSTVQASRVWFTYAGASATDLLIVTHLLGANAIGAVGVVYDGGTSSWAIRTESNVDIPVGEKFNVLVVKQ